MLEEQHLEGLEVLGLDVDDGEDLVPVLAVMMALLLEMSQWISLKSKQSFLWWLF